MSAIPAVRSPSRRPTHPGALLRDDVIPRLGLSRPAFAAAAGIDGGDLEAILGETAPVEAMSAALLGDLLGNGSEFWLRMQAAYDDWEKL
jgi:addiction module HigA family antidote